MRTGFLSDANVLAMCADQQSIPFDKAYLATRFGGRVSFPQKAGFMYSNMNLPQAQKNDMIDDYIQRSLAAKPIAAPKIRLSLLARHVNTFPQTPQTPQTPQPAAPQTPATAQHSIYIPPDLNPSQPSSSSFTGQLPPDITSLIIGQNQPVGISNLATFSETQAALINQGLYFPPPATPTPSFGSPAPTDSDYQSDDEDTLTDLWEEYKNKIPISQKELTDEFVKIKNETPSLKNRDVFEIIFEAFQEL